MRILTFVVALAAGLSGCASRPLAPMPPAPMPEILGAWQLDTDISDDRDAVLAAIVQQIRGSSESRRGRSSAGGGMRGGPSGGRGGGGGRGARSGDPSITPTSASRGPRLTAGANQIAALIPLGERLVLTWDANRFRAQREDDLRTYVTGVDLTVSFMGRIAERQAGWQGAEFVVLSDGERATLEERYAIGPDGILTYTWTLDADPLDDTVTYIQRFTRDTDESR